MLATIEVILLIWGLADLCTGTWMFTLGLMMLLAHAVAWPIRALARPRRRVRYTKAQMGRWLP